MGPPGRRARRHAGYRPAWASRSKWRPRPAPPARPGQSGKNVVPRGSRPSQARPCRAQPSPAHSGPFDANARMPRAGGGGTRGSRSAASSRADSRACSGLGCLVASSRQGGPRLRRPRSPPSAPPSPIPSRARCRRTGTKGGGAGPSRCRSFKSPRHARFVRDATRRGVAGVARGDVDPFSWRRARTARTRPA